MLFVLAETRGMPLERVAKLFGDDPTTIATLSESNAEEVRVHGMKSKRVEVY